MMGALKPAARALAALDRDTYLQVYRGLLRSLIARQLILGQSAIVDCVVPDVVLTEWRELAEEHEASFLAVECVCTDEVLHRAIPNRRARQGHPRLARGGMGPR